MPEPRYQSAKAKPPRTFRFLESVPVHRRLCRECRKMVLAGIEEGAPITVDPHPIPQTEEVAVLVDGRSTYAMLRGDVLCLRDASRIAGGLVGSGIYAAHRCGPR